MTKRNIDRDQRIIEQQAARILKNLGSWLEAKPGRSVVVQFTDEGYRAVLEPSENESRGRSKAGGQTCADALGQIATVASFEEVSR